uniref:Reverse transcriptase zinc-binding domain-containing protein n=1 Tax=Setaria viridis TaxID=4556 RepID=A0A4U6VZN5_SETVI|nr:hypothetical protein SEVIR_2G245400v2 [Setaria viridis]
MQLPCYTCVLCQNNIEELVLHIFLYCPFSKHCWNLIGLQVDDNMIGYQTLESFKLQLAQPFFMEVIVIMSWIATIQRCKGIFREEFSRVIYRAKAKYHPTISSWFQFVL